MRNRLFCILLPAILLILSGCFDTESPTSPANAPDAWVRITYPAQWSTVSGAMEVRVEAGPQDQIGSVALVADGLETAQDSLPPYVFTWNAGSAVASHTLFARAQGAGGSVDSDLITVFVVDTTDHQSPVVVLTHPADWTEVQGVVPVRFEASDNRGVDRLELLVDGILLATLGQAPYVYDWDTAGLTSGNHTLLGRAFDLAGNQALSDLITVTAP